VSKGIIYGKPSSQGISELKGKRSLRAIAEERVGRAMPSLRVLNSFWVAEDGTHKFFEVICVDPQHNAVRNDARINWICNPVHKHRELRGLTSAGKSNRGLRNKGHKDAKVRPSKRANYKRRNQISLKRYR
jgi:large subunit ribosomal protein L15e